MSNQNVATPRFYVDYLSYFHAKGWVIGHEWHDLPIDAHDSDNPYAVNLTPANVTEYEFSDSYLIKSTIFVTPLPYANYNFNFGMVLNHNLTDLGDGMICNFSTRQEDGSSSNKLPNTIALVGASEVNYDNNPDYFNPEQNISICTYSDFLDTPNLNFNEITLVTRNVVNNSHTYFSGGSLKFGTWTIGRYYDMPFSPDLSLKMSHEFDGVAQTETKGGAMLSDARWISTPKWGDREAWEIDDWGSIYSGRRVWDLSWSYVSDSDLEPENYGISPQTLTGEPNFFSEVLHKTMGGHLPFIFCPDTSIEYLDTTKTVPEFAICRFDMDSFERTQVAVNVYNISLKIRECW